MSVDFDELTTNATYSVRIRDPRELDFGATYGYGKRFAQRFEGPYDDTPKYYARRVKWLISKMEAAASLSATDRILIVGAGLGFEIYAFRNASKLGEGMTTDYPNVWGFEPSAYMNSIFSSERLGTGDVMIWSDIRDNALQIVKDALDAKTGGRNFRFVLTSEIFSYHENSELPGLLNACERALDSTQFRRIIHIVNTQVNNLTAINIKPLADWRALADANGYNHTLVDSISREVL